MYRAFDGLRMTLMLNLTAEVLENLRSAEKDKQTTNACKRRILFDIFTMHTLSQPEKLAFAKVLHWRQARAQLISI